MTTKGETRVEVEYDGFTEECIYRGELDKNKEACGEGGVTLGDGTEIFGTWLGGS